MSYDKNISNQYIATTLTHKDGSTGLFTDLATVTGFTIIGTGSEQTSANTASLISDGTIRYEMDQLETNAGFSTFKFNHDQAYGPVSLNITFADHSNSELVSLIESNRGMHKYQPTGQIFFVSPNNGDTHANGNRGGINDPYNLIQDCHDNAIVSNRHDLIILLSDVVGSVTILDEQVTLTKNYFSVRGPGRDFDWKTTFNGDTVTVSGDGISLESFQLNTHTAGNGIGIVADGVDFIGINKLWVNNTRGDGIKLTNCTNLRVENCNFQQTGQTGSGNAIDIIAESSSSVTYGRVKNNYIEDIPSDGIRVSTTSGGNVQGLHIENNHLFECVGIAIDLVDVGVIDTVIQNNTFVGNGTDINDGGTDTNIIVAIHGPEEIAALILENPSFKIATNLGGTVNVENALTTGDITGSMELTLNNNSQIGLIETMRGTDDALLDSSYTVAPSVGDIAGSILQNTGNLLLTNPAGEVTTSNPAAGGGSAHTAEDVATLILQNTGNPLLTDSSGFVTTTGGNLTTEDITGSMELTLNNNSQIGLIETMRGTDDALLDSSYAVAPSVGDIASSILENTGNPLLTDSSGFVTTTGGNLTTEDITGSMELTLNNNSQIGLIETMRGTDDALLDSSYTVAPSIENIAGSILQNTGNLLVTNASGEVNINLDQTIPFINTSNTIGDSLNAARAQGFGKWSLNETTKVLTIYAPDGTTEVAAFDIGPDLSSPLTRTPQ